MIYDRSCRRIPLLLALAGLVVGGLLDLACPRQAEPGQITHPQAQLTVNGQLQEVRWENHGTGHFHIGKYISFDVAEGSDLEKFLRAKEGHNVTVIVRGE